MIPVAVCPFCDRRIRLHKKKDFESFSKEEVYDHFKARHPEELDKVPMGMPYTPIEFVKA